MTICDVKDQSCESFHLNDHTGAELFQSNILYTDFHLRGRF